MAEPRPSRLPVSGLLAIDEIITCACATPRFYRDRVHHGGYTCVVFARASVAGLIVLLLSCSGGTPPGDTDAAVHDAGVPDVKVPTDAQPEVAADTSTGYACTPPPAATIEDDAGTSCAPYHNSLCGPHTYAVACSTLGGGPAPLPPAWLQCTVLGTLEPPGQAAYCCPCVLDGGP
jgi:hypothetical protein